MKLALEALPKSIVQPDRPLVNSAEDALYYAVVQHQFDRNLRGGQGDLQQALLSARGDRAITLNGGVRLTLWDLNTGEVVRSFEDVDDYIGDVVFSPRGDLIAVAVKHFAATFSYSGQPIGPPVHIMDGLSGEIRTRAALDREGDLYVSDQWRQLGLGKLSPGDRAGPREQFIDRKRPHFDPPVDPADHQLP
jgi:hypothetical protein